MRTAFTDLVGCEVPVQLAPMSGVCTPELVAAVDGAGAMAMVASVMTPPDVLDAQLRDLRRRVAGPLGVNFLLLLDVDPEAVDVAAERADYVDFYHGEVDAELVRRAREGGALTGWQVNDVDQARAATDAGCDLVIVRGVEGGGRMYGDQPLRPLLDRVLGSVEAPVLAAGGLATGRDLAVCLAEGAAGVRMGTRFVATEESGAHPRYKQAIVEASADDAMVSDAFSVGLPRPGSAGVLASALVAAAASLDDVLGETPVGGRPMPVHRLSPFPPLVGATGHVEAMALYAGRSAGAVDRIEPAGEVVRRIVAEAQALRPV